MPALISPLDPELLLSEPVDAVLSEGLPLGELLPEELLPEELLLEELLLEELELLGAPLEPLGIGGVEAVGEGIGGVGGDCVGLLALGQPVSIRQTLLMPANATT
ncbi:MAG: hypothetical protein AAGF57_10845 [Pseudomonadota bacterium]